MPRPKRRSKAGTAVLRKLRPGLTYRRVRPILPFVAEMQSPAWDLVLDSQQPFYEVPRRVFCHTEHASFEASVSRISSAGVFIETDRQDLQYTEVVQVTFQTAAQPAVTMAGTVATWVRGKGVRLEPVVETPAEILRILTAWGEGRAIQLTNDLPKVPPRLPPVQRAVLSRLGALSGCKILFIDDNAPLRSAMERTLGRAGAEIVATADPREGLALMARRPFDVVLLDWMLPEMAGEDVLKDIHNTYPEVVVAVVSGTLFWEDAEARLREQGAALVLKKPLDLNWLVRWLEQVVKARAA